jgi:hypothetical protein
MKYNLGKRKVLYFLLIFITSGYVFAQKTTSEKTEEKSSWDLLLIPILETVFKGDVEWRPDWPSDVPCDGFLISHGNTFARVIELSNGKENFILSRNNEGRITEFPFFQTDRYIIVKIDYNTDGMLKRMNLEYKNYASAEDNDGNTADKSEEKPMIIDFKPEFFPYSEFSPGGAFPVITVTSDDSQNFVYLFESPLFMTETWYDGDGNLLVYSKADTYVINGAWRVNSLQIHSADDIQFVDYFYDTYGNITEIRLEDSVFSALYADKRPIYWHLSDFYNELHWDTQGLLTFIRVYEPEENELINEFRYKYQNDAIGNWVKRFEIAYIFQYGLLAANPPSGRGTWNRRIVYF